jgi:dipeptidyl aminopeptidase/acylaminoacyl peptidase
MAQALSAVSDQNIVPDKLPFDTISFVNDCCAVEVISGRAKYNVNLQTYECKKIGDVNERDQQAQAGRGRFRFRRGGMQPPPQMPEVKKDEIRYFKSPDGKWEAFVKNYNLFARSTLTQEIYPLTSDGIEQYYYSPEDISWSYDSKKLVTNIVKPVKKRLVHYVESSPADQLQPKYSEVEYEKPGDPIEIKKPRLFHIDTKKQIEVSDELFADPYYGTENWHWRPDSAAFYFYYNQRGHQVARVIEMNADTGQCRPVIDEQSDTFIDYAHKKYLEYIDKTNEIIWSSERDGWNHLYLYDMNTGRVKNQITKGDWVWRRVDKLDANDRQIWFQASGFSKGQDPYFMHCFRINFDGTGLVALTEADSTHFVQYSPDYKFYTDAYSRIDMPPIYQLKKSSDGSLVMELEKADANALLAAGWKVPEPFVAMSRDDRFEIWGVIYRPTQLDPNKKYPVIEDIYAGPQGSFVPKNWRSFYSQQALVELGFIVVQIDGMGTSNRCRDFHHFSWHNLGDAGLPDRIKWMKKAAEKYPYMDITRVGVYGTSAGGQSATGALLFHPEFYKVGVSSCGCHDNRMDKLWWNELWMGYPVGPHYAAQSNVTNANKLQGRLLLIVGEMDHNVDPSSTMQVVNALIKAKKDFELLVVPGMDHSNGGEYGERKRRDFFVKYLLGQEPPDWNISEPNEPEKQQQPN